MQWTAGSRAGFTTGNPWRTLNPNYPQFNVAVMESDPASLLNHYKKLISLRNTHEVLRKGYYLPATAAAGQVLAYARVYGPEAVLVVANLGSSPAASAATSLAVSTLPAGTYQVTELYTGQPAGAVTVDAQGGFANWSGSLPALGANQTRVLHLTRSQASNTASRQQLTLALYPNPATTQTRLELAHGTAQSSLLQVFDLTGRLVHTAKFTGPSCVLETGSWAPGAYFARVQSGAAVVVQRLVVAR
jgi:hypothetical protein